MLRREKYTPQHAKPGTPKRRRWLGLPILVVVGVLGVAAVAIAAYVILSTINGSVETGEFAIYGTSGSTVTDGDETAGTCTVALSDAGTGDGAIYSVTWTGGAIAGDTCEATLGIAADAANAQDARAQSVTIGSAITGGEVTVELGAACGQTWAPAADAGIPVLFTITSSAEPGTTYDLTGTELSVVPASVYDAGGCA